jgi:hypothetical protein
VALIVAPARGSLAVLMVPVMLLVVTCACNKNGHNKVNTVKIRRIIDLNIDFDFLRAKK